MLSVDIVWGAGGRLLVNGEVNLSTLILLLLLNNHSLRKSLELRWVIV